MLKYLLYLFRRPSKRRLRELLLIVEEERVDALRQAIGWQVRAERYQLQLRGYRAWERRLKGKIALYEKAVLESLPELNSFGFCQIATALRQAYDAPMAKEG